MFVQEIMSKKLVVVNPLTVLRDIKEKFEIHRFHHLLVVEPTSGPGMGPLVGVVSDRDLLSNLAGDHGGEASPTKTAGQIMSRTVLTVSPETKIQHAARLMLEHSISSLPVLSNDNLVGIITSRDVLRWTVEQLEEEEMLHSGA